MNDDYVLSEQSLLVNHGVLRHHTAPAPLVRATSTKDVRNTAIRVLLAVQADMKVHRGEYESRCVGGRTGLTSEAFTAYVHWATGGELSHPSSLALFEGIDVRGAKFVSWDDLLAYIIDAGLKGPVGRVSETLNKYLLTSTKSFPRCSMLTMQLSTFNDRMFLAYDLVTSQEKERCFRITDSGMTTASHVVIPPSASVFAYVAETSTVIMGCLDLKLRVWHMDGSKVYKRMEVTWDSITTLSYEHNERGLWCGSSGGSVARFRLDAEGMPKILFATAPHTSSVTSLCVLPRDGAVISGSSDAGLTIQDPERGTVIMNYEGAQRALLDISYWPEANAFFTCGYSKGLQLWHVTSSSSRPVLLTDNEMPHTQPTVRVQPIGGTSQLLSLDAKGLLKMWDTRMYRCVTNNVVSGAAGYEFHSMVVRPSDKRIFVGSRHAVVTLDYSTVPVGSSISDTESVVDVVYSEERCCIQSVSQTQFMLWEWGTFANVARYENMSASEVVCVCFAGTTKMYLGHASGHITAHNTTNAQTLWTNKTLSGNEILDIVYIGAKTLKDGGEMLLVLDGAHVLHTLVEEPDRQLLARVDLEERLVKCMVWDGALVALAYYGSLEASVSKPMINAQLRELTLVVQGSLQVTPLPSRVNLLGVPDDHITSIAFLAHTGFLAVGVSTGVVEVWSVTRPMLRCLTLTTDPRHVYAATGIGFAPTCYVLMVGCENGALLTFRIHKAILHGEAAEVTAYGKALPFTGPLDHIRYVPSKGVFLATANEGKGKVYRVDAKEVAELSLEALSGYPSNVDAADTTIDLVQQLVAQIRTMEKEALPEKELSRAPSKVSSRRPSVGFPALLESDDETHSPRVHYEEETTNARQMPSFHPMARKRTHPSMGAQTRLRQGPSAPTPTLRPRAHAHPRAMTIEDVVDAAIHRVLTTPTEEENALLPKVYQIPRDAPPDVTRRRLRPPRMVRDTSDLHRPTPTAIGLTRRIQHAREMRCSTPVGPPRPGFFVCKTVGVTSVEERSVVAPPSLPGLTAMRIQQQQQHEARVSVPGRHGQNAFEKVTSALHGSRCGTAMSRASTPVRQSRAPSPQKVIISITSTLPATPLM